MPNDKDGIDDKMPKYIANWDGIKVLAHFLKKPWNSELFGTSLRCPIYFSKVIFKVLHLQFDHRLLRALISLGANSPNFAAKLYFLILVI